MAVGAFSPSVLLRVARVVGVLGSFAVDEVPVASSPAQFRSLLDGTLDAALTSPDNALAYRYVPDNPLGTTADVRIVSAVDGGLGLALYARRGVPLDVLGVDVPDSGFAFAAYALLDSLGISGYRVVALGSTPRRLSALLRGECAATMLNAGSDLRATEEGCVALARVSSVCGPYLGTVLATVGPVSDAVAGLAHALRVTTARILAGELDDVVTAEAATIVGPSLAPAYLGLLRDPAEGLVPGGSVSPASLETVVRLRERFRPGADLTDALAPGSGLVVRA
ncbi:hypothetical protein SAMN05443668_12215 [Cryptosporangium aurantiacum]|uniref:ABC-type nitrate/sulfonate/bicarbonate transport system, substrate-binding protein n=1 Tax=Cryptosporangium aurantiacum TaxID=134849 RepID=A0A1M7RLT0_9ACTN|nr:hypothetical protein SAMN05443668_12215 [Cryptosporangium aurantiacum]